MTDSGPVRPAVPSSRAGSADPDLLVGQAGILASGERHQILESWNDTARPVAAACLPELFEVQAARTPDAPAVVFGDASRKAVLEAAGIARTRLVVITFNRRRAVERVLHYLRHKNPAVPTIVSVADDQEVSLLAQAGARTVFPENLAAGLALACASLLIEAGQHMKVIQERCGHASITTTINLYGHLMPGMDEAAAEALDAAYARAAAEPSNVMPLVRR